MTDAERTAIIRARTAEGLSCEKIAPDAECSGAKVNRIQRALGIQHSRGSGKDRPTREALLACDGMTSMEVFKKFNRGHDTISNWFRHYDIARARCGPRVGQLIDVAQLRALAKEGMSSASIAAKIGTKEIVVCDVAHRSGIKLPASAKRQAVARQKRHRTKAECTRPIAGSTTPRAIERALALLERRA